MAWPVYETLRVACFHGVVRLPLSYNELFISKPKSFAKRANRYGYSRYHQQMSTEKQVLYKTHYIKNTYHVLQ